MTREQLARLEQDARDKWAACEHARKLAQSYQHGADLAHRIATETEAAYQLAKERYLDENDPRRQQARDSARASEWSTER